MTKQKTDLLDHLCKHPVLFVGGSISGLIIVMYIVAQVLRGIFA